jgi:hypothetical protein
VNESSVPGGRPQSEPQVNGFTQITFSVLFVSLSVTQDYFHNKYFSVGANYGKGIPVGFSVANGWFNGKPNASSKTSCDTLSGLSVNGSAGLLLGASESWTPSNRQFTTQVGVFTPQFGGGGSYGFVLSGCGR